MTGCGIMQYDFGRLSEISDEIIQTNNKAGKIYLIKRYNLWVLDMREGGGGGAQICQKIIKGTTLHELEMSDSESSEDDNNPQSDEDAESEDHISKTICW